jgi:hypothetical protein
MLFDKLPGVDVWLADTMCCLVCRNRQMCCLAHWHLFYEVLFKWLTATVLASQDLRGAESCVRMRCQLTVSCHCSKFSPVQQRGFKAARPALRMQVPSDKGTTSTMFTQLLYSAVDVINPNAALLCRNWLPDFFLVTQVTTINLMHACKPLWLWYSKE